MPRPASTSTRLSLLFPPARRLHDAVLAMLDTIARLSAEQTRLSETNRALQAGQDRLTADLAQVSATLTGLQARTIGSSPALPALDGQSAAESERELDRLTDRELQSAAVRNLPFLPGEMSVDENGITIQGYAGAPDGLTENMAFFINGRQVRDVEYPIPDPELKARFPEVRGMGNVFRWTMTEHLDELRGARFWRCDASPTGRYIDHHWRRAVHFMNPRFERFPLPPEANIKRVIGDTSQTRFAMGGAMIFNNLARYLGELGLSWDDFPNVLDWGCGAGRVTRYLISETSCAVTGADIDADNIAWCRAALPSGRFDVVPLRPPTAFRSASFNLVIGLSVMTHLQENDQHLWLSELERITAPGGLVFLSVQGPTQFAYNKFPAKLYREVQRAGYLDYCRDAALDGVVSDKEYYRAAMHSRGYIVDRWGQQFEILDIADAIAGLQDFVVMRRK